MSLYDEIYGTNPSPNGDLTAEQKAKIAKYTDLQRSQLRQEVLDRVGAQVQADNTAATKKVDATVDTKPAPGLNRKIGVLPEAALASNPAAAAAATPGAATTTPGPGLDRNAGFNRGGQGELFSNQAAPPTQERVNPHAATRPHATPGAFGDAAARTGSGTAESDFTGRNAGVTEADVDAQRNARRPHQPATDPGLRRMDAARMPSPEVKRYMRNRNLIAAGTALGLGKVAGDLMAEYEISPAHVLAGAGVGAVTGAAIYTLQEKAKIAKSFKDILANRRARLDSLARESAAIRKGDHAGALVERQARAKRELAAANKKKGIISSSGKGPGQNYNSVPETPMSKGQKDRIAKVQKNLNIAEERLERNKRTVSTSKDPAAVRAAKAAVTESSKEVNRHKAKIATIGAEARAGETPIRNKVEQVKNVKADPVKAGDEAVESMKKAGQKRAAGARVQADEVAKGIGNLFAAVGGTADPKAKVGKIMGTLDKAWKGTKGVGKSIGGRIMPSKTPKLTPEELKARTVMQKARAGVTRAVKVGGYVELANVIDDFMIEVSRTDFATATNNVVTNAETMMDEAFRRYEENPDDSTLGKAAEVARMTQEAGVGMAVAIGTAFGAEIPKKLLNLHANLMDSVGMPVTDLRWKLGEGFNYTDEAKYVKPTGFRGTQGRTYRPGDRQPWELGGGDVGQDNGMPRIPEAYRTGEKATRQDSLNSGVALADQTQEFELGGERAEGLSRIPEGYRGGSANGEKVGAAADGVDSPPVTAAGEVYDPTGTQPSRAAGGVVDPFMTRGEGGNFHYGLRGGTGTIDATNAAGGATGFAQRVEESRLAGSYEPVSKERVAEAQRDNERVYKGIDAIRSLSADRLGVPVQFLDAVRNGSMTPREANQSRARQLESGHGGGIGLKDQQTMAHAAQDQQMQIREFEAGMDDRQAANYKSVGEEVAALYPELDPEDAAAKQSEFQFFVPNWLPEGQPANTENLQLVKGMFILGEELADHGPGWLNALLPWKSDITAQSLFRRGENPLVSMTRAGTWYDWNDDDLRFVGRDSAGKDVTLTIQPAKLKPIAQRMISEARPYMNIQPKGL